MTISKNIETRYLHLSSDFFFAFSPLAWLAALHAFPSYRLPNHQST
jgi:hypothetical protein